MTPPPLSLAPLPAREVVVGDVRLALTDAGTGPPVVLLHGFTGSRGDYGDHFDALAERYRVVAYDHRGHGESSRAEGYSLAALVADLEGVVDACGLDTFTLVGHSMGGMVAQQYALAHPGRLRGLVLVDTGHGPLRVDDDQRRIVLAACDLARSAGMETLLRVQQRLAEGGELASGADVRLREDRPGYAEFCDAKFLATDPVAYDELLREFLDADDRLDALAQCEVSTLVTVGTQDRAFRRSSARIAATMPQARLVELLGAGHTPQFETPGPFRAALEPFLAEVNAG